MTQCKISQPAAVPSACTHLPLPSLLLSGLKKFLKKHAVDEELAVLDKKLGGIVQEKLGINCLYK